MNREELKYWLSVRDASRLEQLWEEADRVRRLHVGDEVHLRGIVEISNRCVRRCRYCGINADNTTVRRYTIGDDDILSCAHEIAHSGYGTVVLQAGEDPSLDADRIATLIRRIKRETGLAVTLGLGERGRQDYELWRAAGADRYLIKIETGNPSLYAHIHPTSLTSEWNSRVDILRYLKALDYEAGSGIMVGIPGQTFDDIVDDILLFGELDLDMLGIGPYLPHPATGLAAEHDHFKTDDRQVPNSELMTYIVNALVRIQCPSINIPTTTALATLNRDSGRELGLRRGANVIMPNATPLRYRECYEIYPDRVCLEEFGPGVRDTINRRIRSVGRTRGSGAGSSVRTTRKVTAAAAADSSPDGISRQSPNTQTEDL